MQCNVINVWCDACIHQTIESIPSINDYVKFGSVDENEVHAASQVVEKKVRFLIEGASHGVVLFTEHGIELLNSRGCEMFQYLSPEVMGQHVSIFFTENTFPEIQKNLITDPKSKQKVRNEIEVFCIRKDESEFPARVGITSDIVEGTRLYTLYVQDITKEKAHERLIVSERDLSERLLENILPKSIAHRLKAGEKLIADTFSNVTILFSDIVQFTNMSSKMNAQELVSVLGDIFSRFDRIVTDLGLTKIKTIGDAYMIVSGAPEERYDHAESMMECGLRMLIALERLREETGRDIRMRIGIHTGQCIAGVIGVKKFAYDVWSSDVNIASRMESTGIPDRIQVSRKTYELLHEKFSFEPREGAAVKGIGEVTTYVVTTKEIESASKRLDKSLVSGFKQDDEVLLDQLQED
jgi:PAS domain S-box-containing protein